MKKSLLISVFATLAMMISLNAFATFSKFNR